VSQPLKVFISFRSVDLPWADWIAGVLRAQGHEVRYQREFAKTQSFIKQINEALNWCNRLVLVLSAKYFDSPYTAIEWEAGLQRELEERQRLLCTVRVERFTVPSLLRVYPHLDLFALDLDSAAADRLSAHVRDESATIAAPFPGRKGPSRPLREIVPYPRPAHFLFRDPEMATIVQNIGGSSDAGKVVVLKGMPGVGKTSLAVEFCHKSGLNHDAVFWLEAASLETDLARLYGEILGEADESNPKTRVEGMIRWLAENNNYLLIINGVDRADEFAAVESLLERGGRGHLLATSRLGGWERYGVVVAIEPWSPSQGAKFLATYTGGWVRPDRSAEGLVEELGGLPLSLQHAGAFITENRLTCAEYAERLRNSQPRDRKKWADLTEPCALALTTLSPLTRAILSLWSWLAPQPLARSELAAGAVRWIHAARRLLPDGDAPSAMGDETEDFALMLHRSLAELERQSLLSLDATTVRLNPMVQAVVRDTATAEAQRAQLMMTTEITWETLCEGTPPDSVISHAAALVSHARRLNITSEVTLTLGVQAGVYFLRLGLPAKAEPYLKGALDDFTKLRGEAAADTQAATIYLARCMLGTGHFSDAEPLLRRVVNQYDASGASPVEHAAACSELASTLRQLGQFKEAESLYRRGLKLTEGAPPDVLLARADQTNNLGLFLREQGRFAEAEFLLRRSVELAQRILMVDPDNAKGTLAASQANLGVLLRLTRRLDEAEEAFRTAIRIWGTCSNSGIPSIAAGWSGLASVLMEQARFEEADLWLHRSRRCHEEVFGIGHVETMLDSCDLAWLYTCAGRLSEARQWFDLARTEIQAAVPSTHWYQGHLLGRYGFFLQQGGQDMEAAIVFAHALELLTATLGPTHFRTAWVRDRLARLEVKKHSNDLGG
jgi:tetratricopeptide (TPR) repeat protein